MKNMKFVRTWAMFALAFTVMLSVTGGTIAWFTDSAESTGNVIETGTLDVKLYAVNKQTFDSENFEWLDEYEVTDSSAPLFNYKNWEPGRTEVQYVKLENAGSLAFKWQLNVKPAISLKYYNAETDEYDDSDMRTLAKEIEVYMVPTGDKEYKSFADIKDAFPDDYVAPTLLDLIEDEDGAAYGVMLPNGKDIPDNAPAYVTNGDIEMVIALHMKETAGNECQGLSISDGFVIELRATQLASEQDSFGTDYDATATNDLPSAFVLKLSEEELDAINGGDLDVGYLFSTTETPDQVKNNSYKDWHADFAISFDQDVTNEVALAGYYELYSENWISIPVDLVLDSLYENGVIPSADKIPANTPVRLLGEAAAKFASGPIHFSYETLCNGVVNFYCGGLETSEGSADGITMTVSLNLYEPSSIETNENREGETGKSVTLGTFQYTF